MKTDENFKRLGRELDQYCTILIGIVTSRQWEINADVEEVLRHILKTKKFGTDVTTTR